MIDAGRLFVDQRFSIAFARWVHGQSQVSATAVILATKPDRSQPTDVSCAATADIQLDNLVSASSGFFCNVAPVPIDENRAEHRQAISVWWL